MNHTLVYLKKNEDRRLRAGHLWIYSNEIDVQRSPLKSFTSGQLVTVVSQGGRPWGTGYINPNVLLSVRILIDKPHAKIDATFFVEKIQQALALRNSYFTAPYYRLIYGESDGLPGLVVDRFGDTLVIQITTAGMEALKDEILTALKQVIQPQHILLRAEGSFRELENLPQYTEVVLGEPLELTPFEENGVKFLAPIFSGQKTGWFYDHRLNRLALKEVVKDKQVLDVFSYIGGWGIQAACFGATHVTCIDSSAQALGLVAQHAKLNQVEDKVTTLEQDAFDALNALIQAGKKFDVIILDPPAFIKRRKDIESGKQAYYRINELALKLLNSPGILVSASCSMHLAATDLVDVIRNVAKQQQRSAKIIMQGHQGPDHPIHPAIEETAYLKSFMVYVN